MSLRQKDLATAWRILSYGFPYWKRIAAVLILSSGLLRADPIASLFVAALMLRAAYGLVRGAGRSVKSSQRAHPSLAVPPVRQ